MKKTYIKPEVKTIYTLPMNIMVTSLPIGEDEDEFVTPTANQTIFEDFDEFANTDGISSYEQQWNSRYDW
jgi:hypothetical protein